jgi:hypothetical protein
MPEVIMPSNHTGSQSVVQPETSTPPLPASNGPGETGIQTEQETRKGQPGSKATFPNGLKDVHEMAAAAEALSGLGGDDERIQVAERKGMSDVVGDCSGH